MSKILAAVRKLDVMPFKQLHSFTNRHSRFWPSAFVWYRKPSPFTRVRLAQYYGCSHYEIPPYRASFALQRYVMLRPVLNTT